MPRSVAESLGGDVKTAARRAALRHGVMEDRGEPSAPQTFSVTEDGGSAVVAHRFTMVDPLDSEFYEGKSGFLEDVAKSLPPGLVAEYVPWKGAPESKMIGDKYIAGRQEDVESGPSGRETTMTYDVVEALRVSPAAPVAESLDPDTDELDDMMAQALADPDPLAGDDAPEPDEDDLAPDSYFEADFPAWAVEYAQDGGVGMVSRQEFRQVQQWLDTVKDRGYDVSAAEFGEDEFWSDEPAFGLPCDCVTARFPLADADSITESEAPAQDPVAEYLAQG